MASRADPIRARGGGAPGDRIACGEQRAERRREMGASTPLPSSSRGVQSLTNMALSSIRLSSNLEGGALRGGPSSSNSGGSAHISAAAVACHNWCRIVPSSTGCSARYLRRKICYGFNAPCIRPERDALRGWASRRRRGPRLHRNAMAPSAPCRSHGDACTGGAGLQGGGAHLCSTSSPFGSGFGSGEKDTFNDRQSQMQSEKLAAGGGRETIWRRRRGGRLVRARSGARPLGAVGARKLLSV
jgi:hypothetical protein